MKQYWQKLSERIDALSLRERGLIFVMAVAILLALFITLLMDPLQAKRNAMSQDLLNRQAKISASQAQVQALLEAREQDPDAANKKRMEQLQQQVAEMDKTLEGVQQGLVSPERMPQLLKDLLLKNQQLHLISIKTLPVSTLVPSKKDTAASNAKGAKQENKASPEEAQIYKHGVEITVQGTYLDLLAYLSELEGLPWRMYWGNLDLKVNEYPQSTLVLTLYTLSLDQTWMSL
jgi:MSHA biogenesis protein MshJ